MSLELREERRITRRVKKQVIRLRRLVRFLDKKKAAMVACGQKPPRKITRGLAYLTSRLEQKEEELNRAQKRVWELEGVYDLSAGIEAMEL